MICGLRPDLPLPAPHGTGRTPPSGGAAAAVILQRGSADEAAGEPTSYLTLEEGTKVLSSDGESVGSVAHVLADEDEDIFDGLVIEADRGHVFADATQIDALRSDGVTLKLDAAACRALPEPSENPAALEAGPDDTVPDGLSEKLRRAWDRVSGNY